MIDIETETLISLAEAAALVPCGRKGRTPDVKTIYAWTTGGCRGVVLESVQVGGRRCTSKQAIRRFIQVMTTNADTPKQAAGRKSNAARQAMIAAELVRFGVRTAERMVGDRGAQ